VGTTDGRKVGWAVGRAGPFKTYILPFPQGPAPVIPIKKSGTPSPVKSGVRATKTPACWFGSEGLLLTNRKPQEVCQVLKS
jgi:hypothetical protein